MCPSRPRGRLGSLQGRSAHEQRRPTAAAAGKIDVGGDLTVNRLGFGAMRITGPGIWGDPPRAGWSSQARGSGSPTAARSTYAGPARAAFARLRLDRIDLYQFHRPDPRVPIAESIGALAELKDEGKIRHIGVSNVTEQQFREAERVRTIVSVQNRYNVVDRSSEPMLDLCDHEMLVFIPWAPIEQTGTVPALMAAARRRGVTERQVALAWLLTRSPQVLPIPGSGDPDHAEQNIAAASIELTAKEIRAITLAALSR